jgi:hypothetical protein
MRMDFVVVTTPGLDHDPRLLAAPEPFERQALVAELAVEALGTRTPQEFALSAGTCAGGNSDGMPETLNQPGTNSG